MISFFLSLSAGGSRRIVFGIDLLHPKATVIMQTPHKRAIRDRQAMQINLNPTATYKL
jgi:hypothetical protein